jgi:type III restriction enzyme
MAYTKNHNLGLEVPVPLRLRVRKYRPGLHRAGGRRARPDDLLHLVVEIKGYRREDAKEKKSTMDTYWVPGVNNLGTTAAGPSPSSPTSTRSRPTSKPRSRRSSIG